MSSRRLRFHSAAILVSGLMWAVLFLLALPALAAHGSGEQDLGSAVGDSVLADGCGLGLGGYHLLLCVALGLEALRAVAERCGRTTRVAADDVSRCVSDEPDATADQPREER